MEGARILLVEDNEAIVGYLNQLLPLWGHEVVDEARTVSEALLKIVRISKERKPVDVALIDGELDGGSPADGETVAYATARLLPGVHIIGISAQHQLNGVAENIYKSDINALKARLSELERPAAES